MSRLALAWSGHEEIMLVWLQFCFPIESTISSGFPVISNNDLSLLAKLENFFQPSYGLANRWGDSCLATKGFIAGAGGRPSPEAPLVTGENYWRLHTRETDYLKHINFYRKTLKAQPLTCRYALNPGLWRIWAWDLYCNLHVASVEEELLISVRIRPCSL